MRRRDRCCSHDGEKEKGGTSAALIPWRIGRDRTAYRCLTWLRPLFALRNQTSAAIAAGIDPQPAQRDSQAIAYAYKEVDVSPTPDPPGDPAAYTNPSKVDHG
jgi:hypothetical protein